MDNEVLLALTSDIVSAHVANNPVAADDLPRTISSIYAALSQLGQAVGIEEPELSPAVTIRGSVKPDAISCLECGRKLKMLKRHLSTHHDLTPAAYRTPFHISRNELAVAEVRLNEWHLIRVWSFARVPHAYMLRPPLEGHLELTATSFLAGLR